MCVLAWARVCVTFNQPLSDNDEIEWVHLCNIAYDTCGAED